MNYMKRILILFAFAVLLGTPAMAQLKTKVATQTQHYALSEGSKWGLDIDLSVEYVASSGSKTVTEKINKGIANHIFGSNFKGTIPEMLKQYAEAAAKEYREENKEVPADALTNWKQTGAAKFVDSFGSMITYEVVSVYDNGTSHPMMNKTCTVFNTKTGEPVSVESLFLPGYDATLAPLIQKYKYYAMNEKNKYFENTIISNNNFMVTPRGIVFVYNPYDIAPYDNGIIHITVPWSELKSILVK